MLTHTWCIAWERDLAHLLTSIDTVRIQELVYMVPGWRSKSGQWSSREVREVWLTRSIDDNEFMCFIDSEGDEFDGGLQTQRTGNAADRRLLLKIEPTSIPHHSKKNHTKRPKD